METKAKRRLRNDIILAFILVAAAVTGIIITKALQTEGDYAVITVDGKEIKRFSLKDNTEYTVYTGENKDEYNTVVIKDGKAFVKSANCPDRICAAHKPISDVGETVVCLPHKLVVSIESEKDGGLDAVT